jgi:hypothetical protein
MKSAMVRKYLLHTRTVVHDLMPILMLVLALHCKKPYDFIKLFRYMTCCDYSVGVPLPHIQLKLLLTQFGNNWSLCLQGSLYCI